MGEPNFFARPISQVPPYPEDVETDEERDRFLRFAGWFGARSGDEVFLSFTSAVIAFLFAEGRVSLWFQRFASGTGVDGNRSDSPGNLLGFVLLPSLQALHFLQDAQIAKQALSGAVGRPQGSSVFVPANRPNR